ncbi:cytochrome b5 [Atractiella rhizophila]|nr:cytochrome b5 [Atractiella rhizophila]
MRFLTSFKYALLTVICAYLLGELLEFEWSVASKYAVKQWRTVFPQPKKLKYFSERQLKRFNGDDPTLPIYLALDGEVYDVSANRRTYGPGGSYNHFAGVDHARAFVTGCFQEHKTHDLRGLNEKELSALNGWKEFYRNSDKYFQVGYVVHQPIDPSSPLPQGCAASQKPQ